MIKEALPIHPRVNQAVIKVVDTQLETGDPVVTTETFVRLVNEGRTPAEAKELIGCVVLAEVFDVLKSGKPFDPERYAEALRDLPELPKSL